MSDSRVRIWFSLFVLAVFCVGLAGGVLIGRRMAGARLDARAVRGLRDVPPGMPEGRRGGPLRGLLVERLVRDLELTPDQRTKIDTILADSRTRVETLQRDVRQRFESEGRGLRDQIRSVLTPEQQQKFDQHAKEGRGPFGRRGPPR